MSSATVARNALISFSGDILPTDQTNIRDTILEAIESANDEATQYKSPDKWFTQYWKSLTANKWYGAAPSTQSSVTSADYWNAPIAKTVLQQIMDSLNHAQSALLKQVLQALQLPRSAEAQIILNQCSTNTTSHKATNSSDPIRAVNLMVGVCHPTPSGSAILESCHLSYQYVPPDALFGFEGRVFNVQAVNHTIEFDCANYQPSSTASDDSSVVVNIPLDPSPVVASTSNSISSSQSDEIKTWANNHIKTRIIYDSNDSSKEIAKHNIIVYQGPKVASGYPFDVVLFSVLEISGSIDLSSFACNFNAFLILPLGIVPKIPIGSISGNLITGITLAIDLTIAKGSLTLHILNTTELYCMVDLKSIVGDWNVDLDLFTIPFL